MSGGPFGSKPWPSRSCRVQRCHVLIVSTTHAHNTNWWRANAISTQIYNHCLAQDLEILEPTLFQVLTFGPWLLTASTAHGRLDSPTVNIPLSPVPYDSSQPHPRIVITNFLLGWNGCCFCAWFYRQGVNFSLLLFVFQAMGVMIWL